MVLPAWVENAESPQGRSYSGACSLCPWEGPPRRLVSNEDYARWRSLAIDDASYHLQTEHHRSERQLRQ